MNNTAHPTRDRIKEALKDGCLLGVGSWIVLMLIIGVFAAILLGWTEARLWIVRLGYILPSIALIAAGGALLGRGKATWQARAIIASFVWIALNTAFELISA